MGAPRLCRPLFSSAADARSSPRRKVAHRGESPFMQEPERICRACLRELEPEDEDVVLTVRDVSDSGFSTSGDRHTSLDHAYFHRNHQPPGYRIVEVPPPRADLSG